MAMAVLDDLSSELFLQIFSLLPCSDLAAACLVSRRCLLLSQSRLYTEVSLTPGGLPCFVRTVITHPALAACVRTLDVEWESSLPTTPTEVQLSRLQHLLPSLETLHILPPFNHAFSDPFPASTPATLQSLRNFTWRRHGDSSGISATQLLTLLTLPSIRHITAHMAPGPGLDMIDPALVAPYFRTSTVTHLTLQHGDMTAGALTRIMHLPRALTHFSYADTHLDPLGGWDLPMFRLALSCARETLESLTLGLCSSVEDNLGWGIGGGLGALGDWPVLRSVECSMMALMGMRENAVGGMADVLPKAVREVAIIVGGGGWEGADVVEQVERMVESGLLRWLEVVTIESGAIGDVDYERLRGVCELGNVKLVIRC